MSDQKTTPAGWYPAEDGRQRWWNGIEWTDTYQETKATKAKIRTPLWVPITVGVVALVLGASFGAHGDNSRITSLESQVEELKDQNAELREESASPEEEAPAPAPAAEGPDLTLSQEQAIEEALSYLNFTAFSRTGLIEQLEYEGFSTEDATFAVDSITVDWNAQAAATAESYLDSMSFSRAGLIEQLLYEGFTAAQAEFGVTAVGY